MYTLGHIVTKRWHLEELVCCCNQEKKVLKKRGLLFFLGLYLYDNVFIEISSLPPLHPKKVL